MNIYDEIANEVAAQEEKWGEQNHYNGTGPNIEWIPLYSWNMYAIEIAEELKSRCDLRHKKKTGTWLDILLEEMAEAFAEEDPQKLRRELIQVAAVAANWVRCIDRNG